MKFPRSKSEKERLSHYETMKTIVHLEKSINDVFVMKNIENDAHQFAEALGHRFEFCSYLTLDKHIQELLD